MIARWTLRALAIAAATAAAAAQSGLSAQTPTQQTQPSLRDRVAAAVETVEGACAQDIQNFCGKVTRGDGRLLSCMQAYDDQLSRRCQMALYRVSRNVEAAVKRVGRIADACWADIEANCRDADRIEQCVLEKRGSFSNTCKAAVAAVRNAVQGLAATRGLPVTSSEGTDLGQVVEITKGPDGSIQSIEIAVERPLGMGPRTVTIGPDKFEQIGDHVRLLMGRDEVRGLPETKGNK